MYFPLKYEKNLEKPKVLEEKLEQPKTLGENKKEWQRWSYVIIYPL